MVLSLMLLDPQKPFPWAVRRPGSLDYPRGEGSSVASIGWNKLSGIERRPVMAMQEGEVYRCPDAACGCEVTVTKGTTAGHGGDRNPTCCCGHTMDKVG